MEEKMARFSSYEREDMVEKLKGDYQHTIEHTDNKMIELDSFLFGSSFD